MTPRRRTDASINKKTRPKGGSYGEPLGALGLGDETGLEGLDRDPLALDATVGLEDADALHVRLEGALGLLDELEADAAALLRLTAMDDAAALDGTLAGDAADAGHGVRAPLESRSKGLAGRLARGKWPAQLRRSARSKAAKPSENKAESGKRLKTTQGVAVGMP